MKIVSRNAAKAIAEQFVPRRQIMQIIMLILIQTFR